MPTMRSTSTALFFANSPGAMYGLSGDSVVVSLQQAAAATLRAVFGVLDLIYILLGDRTPEAARFDEAIRYSHDLGPIALYVCAVIAFCFPNSYQLFHRYDPALADKEFSVSGPRYWRPTAAWAMARRCGARGIDVAMRWSDLRVRLLWPVPRSQ